MRFLRTSPDISGSAETMERMFERDKDELRSMGIEISVGQLDPLFEDEIGYLIKSSDIQIQPNEFSKDELLLMTMAANVWKESAFADISQKALMKVASLDGKLALTPLPYQ
jgi:proteasome accessory factor B